jgi:spore coat polysaccharide biosynthesis protein SpsF
VSERLYSDVFGGAAIVIQARSRSSRLPGKTLAIVEGRPLLAWQIERLRTAGAPVIVATSANREDDTLADVAAAAGARLVRGPEMDVLARYGMIVARWPFRVIGFCGADQPLADPALFRRLFAEFTPPYTRTVGQPYGLHLWAVSADAIVEADQMAESALEREHTGAFWDQRPTEYPCHVIAETPDESHHRLTVDHPADLTLHRHIIRVLADRWPHVTTQDVLDVLHANPGWETDTVRIRQWKWAGFEDAVRVKA